MPSERKFDISQSKVRLIMEYSKKLAKYLQNIYLTHSAIAS